MVPYRDCPQIWPAALLNCSRQCLRAASSRAAVHPEQVPGGLGLCLSPPVLDCRRVFGRPRRQSHSTHRLLPGCIRLGWRRASQ